MKTLIPISLAAFAFLFLSFQPLDLAVALGPPGGGPQSKFSQCRQNYNNCLSAHAAQGWSEVYTCTNTYGQCLATQNGSRVTCEFLVYTIRKIFFHYCETNHPAGSSELAVCLSSVIDGGENYFANVCPSGGFVSQWD